MNVTEEIAKQVDQIEPVWGFEPVEELEDIGRCNKCGEMTAVNDPCCNAPVWFEGELEWGRFEEEE